MFCPVDKKGAQVQLLARLKMLYFYMALPFGRLRNELTLQMLCDFSGSGENHYLLERIRVFYKQRDFEKSLTSFCQHWNRRQAITWTSHDKSTAVYIYVTKLKTQCILSQVLMLVSALIQSGNFRECWHTDKVSNGLLNDENVNEIMVLHTNGLFWP